MPIQVPAGETDDRGFLEAVNAIVSELIADHAADQFWILRVDNWFDHKWLGFSGYGLIASNIPLDGYDTVKADSSGKGNIPAICARQGGEPIPVCAPWGWLYRIPLPALPHSNERKHSEANLRRRIQDFMRSGCFVWYSANTVADGRGSVMVYVIRSAPGHS